VHVVQRVNVHHSSKFRVNESDCCGGASIFRFFSNGGRPPSWICYMHVWTAHDEYLVVFIAVQNFVGIDVVVSIICKC